jgi:dTDP-4-amino-4,6-dideoxygalactose transaminase
MRLRILYSSHMLYLPANNDNARRMRFSYSDLIQQVIPFLDFNSSKVHSLIPVFLDARLSSISNLLSESPRDRAQDVLLSHKSHYKWPLINKEIKDLIVTQADEEISIYSNGGVFKTFEDAFKKLHHRKFALLFSSGTSAIQAAYFASGLKEGDEVLVPVYTFFATITPLLSIGARPVLCDCDDDGNFDPQEIVNKTTKRTRAVVVTHMWGIPCKMNEIMQQCQKRNLMLFEDCSHAHGAKIKGRLVGTFGTASMFSLQGEKIISGGEGGILITDDQRLFENAVLFGHYNKRSWQDVSEDNVLRKFATTGFGLKLRAHPLAVRIALYHLQTLNDAFSTRAKHCLILMNVISKIPSLSAVGLTTKDDRLVYKDEIQPSFYTLILQFKSEFVPYSRDEFVNACVKWGLKEVQIPNSTCPVSRLPLFQGDQQGSSTKFGNLIDYEQKLLKVDVKKIPLDLFSNAEKFHQSAVRLPVWSDPRDTCIVHAYATGLEAVHHQLMELKVRSKM